MDAYSGGAQLTSPPRFTFSGFHEETQIRAAVQKLARAWPILGSHLRSVSSEVSRIQSMHQKLMQLLGTGY
jgi:hypothetical protein